MIHLIQLEPLEARYTKQWSKWIPNALSVLWYKFREIHWVKSTDKIEVGDVLDVYNTSIRKTQQMLIIIEDIKSWKIKSWDTIWFADLWFPWIENIFYIKSMLWLDIKITWVLHAGTWDDDDFTVRNWFRKWATGFEETIFRGITECYVGSKYHKEIISDYFGGAFDSKIKVTWLFFNADYVRDSVIASEKHNIVVFPHRLSTDKKVEKFDKLSKTKYISWIYNFVKSVEVTSNKKEFYNLLAKSKIAVSFDWQETFWYSMLEAMSLWVIPLCYDGKSYKDTIPEKYRWKTEEELINKIVQVYNWALTFDFWLIQSKLEKYHTENIVLKMFK